MIVKIVDAVGIKGGKSFALCDDNGDMLPCQTKVKVSSCAGGDYPTVTATFFIDGKNIRLVE
jgi:hypothetical protein